MITSFLKEAGKPKAVSELEITWAYIGRFMWGFAILESAVNEIFVQLFNLSAGASLIFIGNLDFRKKLQLVDVGLKDQGIDKHREALKRLHKLTDIRNVVAHFAFGPEIIPGDEGIFFDYVNKSGELKFAHKRAEANDSSTRITYSEFDAYDTEAREILDTLESMHGSFDPIVDISENMAHDISAILGSSDNIILLSDHILKDK